MVYLKRLFWLSENLFLKIPQFAEFSKKDFVKRKKNNLCTPCTPLYRNITSYCVIPLDFLKL
jgi:hypothetical protein